MRAFGVSPSFSATLRTRSGTVERCSANDTPQPTGVSVPRCEKGTKGPQLAPTAPCYQPPSTRSKRCCTPIRVSRRSTADVLRKSSAITGSSRHPPETRRTNPPKPVAASCGESKPPHCLAEAFGSWIGSRRAVTFTAFAFPGACGRKASWPPRLRPSSRTLRKERPPNEAPRHKKPRSRGIRGRYW